MHIVSWNTKYESMEEAKLHSDGLAVLALLFKLSTYNNTVLDPIINAIPYVKDPGRYIVKPCQVSLLDLDYTS